MNVGLVDVVMREITLNALGFPLFLAWNIHCIIVGRGSTRETVMKSNRRRISDMRIPKRMQIVATAVMLLLVAGCGDADESATDEAGGNAYDAGGAPSGVDAGSAGNRPSADASAPKRDTFVPEEEEFVVKAVASTENFVFVPNSSEESSTVARIDGRDLSVVPVEVGLKPVAVRAADVKNVGSVAYVLSEGNSAVAIIRAEKISKHKDPSEQVSLIPVPKETNAIRLSPDGRHLIAYIDPDKPLPPGTSIASLQVASLVRLGSKPSEDTSFQLSVSRLVQEVEFTEDGSEAFIVGRDGVNRLRLNEIESDAFIPPLDLRLSDQNFAPQDREVEVSPDGSFLVIRSSKYYGIAVYRPAESAGEEGELKLVDLPGRPTDIDLHVPKNGDPSVIASLPQQQKIGLIDVDKVLQSSSTASGNGSGNGNGEYTPPEGVNLVDIEGATPGLSQLTPDQKDLLTYTGNDSLPKLGVLDVEKETVRSYQLRNQIRSVAVAPDSKSAVVVHEKREGPPASNADALEFFQHNHGLTIFDIASGYRRPVTLQANPAEVVMTSTQKDKPILYAMLRSVDAEKRGVMRVDLKSYRSDFFNLPREPNQLGVVAGRIFVSQESEEGRITFFDIETGERKTVSGYELNAGID